MTGKNNYRNILETDKEKAARWARDYYHRNKEKCKERHSIWYERNKEYSLEKQKIKKREKKLWAIEYLGNVCQSCGGIFHPAVYEFHHLDPTTKDRDPSKMLSLSKERLQNELNKCELLCANCHRVRHHGDNY